FLHTQYFTISVCRPAISKFLATYSAVARSSGEPATWGRAVRIFRCCSASAGLGTARNSWSIWYCLLKSRKPKICEGAPCAGAACADLAEAPGFWAKLERIRTDA